MTQAVSEGTHRINGPLLMPFSNVMHLTYLDKLRATQLAGFGELSMHPHEVRDIMRGGLSARDMLLMADDYGVRITRLDPLSHWNPHWLPDNMDDAYVQGFNIEAGEFFDLCEQLGCTHASLNATFPAASMSFDEVVEHYAKTCEMGAKHGVICDLENIPVWSVRTVEQAWNIVRSAGVANGGLVFDTLHYIRSGSTLDMIRAVPDDQIHCVQVNDGPLVLPKGVELKDNCFDRLWPGEGEFPLSEIMQTLDEKGCLNQVNPEVFSPANRGRSAEEIAQLSSTSIRRALTLVGVAC